MPVLPKRSDNPFLDGAATGPTDRDAHFIVATKTVQLVLKYVKMYNYFFKLPTNINM